MRTAYGVPSHRPRLPSRHAAPAGITHLARAFPASGPMGLARTEGTSAPIGRGDQSFRITRDSTTIARACATSQTPNPAIAAVSIPCAAHTIAASTPSTSAPCLSVLARLGLMFSKFMRSPIALVITHLYRKHSRRRSVLPPGLQRPGQRSDPATVGTSRPGGAVNAEGLASEGRAVCSSNGHTSTRR